MPDELEALWRELRAFRGRLAHLEATEYVGQAGDADTVDSIHAAATPTANKLLAMNANAKFPTHTIAGSLTVEAGLNVGTTGAGVGQAKTSDDVIAGTALVSPSARLTLLAVVLTAGGELAVGNRSHVRIVQNTRAIWTTEDVTSITGGENGQLLFLVPMYYGEDIRVLDSATVGLAGGVAFDLLHRAGAGVCYLMLIYSTALSRWFEIARADDR